MWSTGTITEIGKSILAAAAGGSTLVIDGAASGTETVSEEALRSSVDVAGDRKTLPVVECTVENSGVRFSVQFTATSGEPYIAKQIGIFGHIGSEQPGLLAIYQDENGIPIPSENDMPDFLYIFYATIQISNLGDISLSLDPSALVSQRQLEQMIDEEIPGMVSDWLDAHVDPETGYVIDNSLTISGAAADAKATGDVKSVVTKVNADELFTVPRLYSNSIGGAYPFSLGYYSGEVGETLHSHTNGVTKNALCANRVPLAHPARLTINNSSTYVMRVRIIDLDTLTVLAVSELQSDDYYANPSDHSGRVGFVVHVARTDNAVLTQGDLDTMSGIFGVYYSTTEYENARIGDLEGKSVFSVPRKFALTETGNYEFRLGYWGGDVGEQWTSSNSGTKTARVTYAFQLSNSARISIGNSDTYVLRIRLVDKATKTVLTISDLQSMDYFVYLSDFSGDILAVVNIQRRDGDTITQNDLDAISELFSVSYSVLEHLEKITSKSSTIAMPMELGDLSRPSYLLYDQSAQYEHFYQTMRTPHFLDVRLCSSYTITSDYSITAVYYDSEYRFVSTAELVSGDENSIPIGICFARFLATKPDGTAFTHSAEILNIVCNGDAQLVKATDNQNNSRNMTMCYVVSGQIGRDHSGSTTQNRSLVDTTGLLRLPPNYSNTGAPVRLVVYAHGSEDYTRKWQTAIRGEVGNDEVITYLVNEGFAVFDSFGHSSDAVLTNGVAHTYGSVDCMNCYIAGIRRIMDIYNVRDDGIYVTGISSGGLAALNLAFNNTIPVLACAPMAPAITPFRRSLGYSEEQRKEYAWAMGFTGDDSVLVGRGSPTPSAASGSNPAFTQELFDYLRANAERVIGYNPMWNGVVGVTFSQLVEWALEISTTTRLAGGDMDPTNWETVARICKTPIKIWIANDDKNVPPEIIKNFVRTGKNGGGVCELRLVPDGQGGHYAYTSSETTERATGVTSLGLPFDNIPIYWLEMVNFFRSF